MPRKPHKKKPAKRPSGTLGNNPLANLDLSIFTEGYKDIQEEYKKFLCKTKGIGEKAYRITYKDQPDIFCVVFVENKNKAKSAGYKYFKDSFHPYFTCNSYFHISKNCRMKRCPDLDKYWKTGKIPIPDLLKATGRKLPCSVCGKDHFDYSDYEIGRCFVLEGEGSINSFIDGYILCYECYRKYIK